MDRTPFVGWVSLAAALVAVAATTGQATAAESRLPRGFVYLRSVDPSIAQEIRYAGSHNFMGRPSAGYDAAECILARPVAEALARVQRSLASDNLALKVYDCYRPARAVREFRDWSRRRGDDRMKVEFFPDVDKSRLFALGYIASRSVHSRGNAVDLTLIRKDVVAPTFEAPASLRPCTAPAAERTPDTSLDLGTGYDCFSDLSATANRNVGDIARRNRARLVTAMTLAGFNNYEREWWHFELPGAGTDEAQDIPIAPVPAATAEPAIASKEEPTTRPGAACRPGSTSPIEMRIACAPTPVAVYDRADGQGKVLAELGEDAAPVMCERCSTSTAEGSGSDSGRDLHRDDRCLVAFYARGAAEMRGWIAARNLAGPGETPACKEE